MAEIVVRGGWVADLDLLRPLLEAGHSVRFERGVLGGDGAAGGPLVMFAAPDGPPDLALVAAPRRHVYRRGDPVPLDRADVLTVESGVLAQTVVHPDGAEVLLGLLGPGGFLIGHGPDGCGLRLRAQTALTVVFQEWGVSAREPEFAARVTARLRQMEAWAAVQARPSLEHRLLGLLGLLAEPFGVPRAGDTLVDVRLTHAQLASASGATRTTVTRLLGELRGRSLLGVEGHGGEERFVLPDPRTGEPGSEAQTVRHDAA